MSDHATYPPTTPRKAIDLQSGDRVVLRLDGGRSRTLMVLGTDDRGTHMIVTWVHSGSSRVAHDHEYRIVSDDYLF